MPNRILKESICTSETIDELSPLEETAFYRLLVNCDDYGRMDGRASVLKARLFPLKDVRISQMSEIINKLASAGLVSLYTVDGKPFVQTVNWDRHQIIRAKKSKYPSPANDSIQPIAPADICNHLISDDSKCPRNPIQSESESQSESEVETPAPTPAQEAPSFASAQDASTYRENMAAIEKLARHIGLPWEPIDYDKAESLMADYGVEWLTQAMIRTGSRAEKSRSWGYVEGILRNWRKKGGMDDPATPPQAPVGKRVTEQQYTQRSYGEIDLNKYAAQMMAQTEAAAQ